jgi:hypothetical protein
MIKQRIIESIFGTHLNSTYQRILFSKTKEELDILKKAYDLGCDVNAVFRGVDFKPLVDLANKGYDIKPFMHIPLDLKAKHIPKLCELLEECLKEGLDIYMFTQLVVTKFSLQGVKYIVNELKEGLNFTHESELYHEEKDSKAYNVDRYYHARKLGVSPYYADVLYRYIPLSYHELLQEAQQVLGEQEVYDLLCYDGGCAALLQKDPIFALIRALLDYNIPIEKVYDFILKNKYQPKYITKCLRVTKGRLVPKTPMSYVELLYENYGEDFKGYVQFLNDNKENLEEQFKQGVSHFALLGAYHAYKVAGVDKDYPQVVDTLKFIDEELNGDFWGNYHYKPDLAFIACGGDVYFYGKLFPDYKEYSSFIETFVTTNNKNRRTINKDFYYIGYAAIADIYTSNRDTRLALEMFSKEHNL